MTYDLRPSDPKANQRMCDLRGLQGHVKDTHESSMLKSYVTVRVCWSLLGVYVRDESEGCDFDLC